MSMFGMLGLSRAKNMFAALPHTRAVATETSLLVKLPGIRHERLEGGHGPGAGWVTFEMESSEDIAEALRWLERAYARSARRTR